MTSDQLSLVAIALDKLEAEHPARHYAGRKGVCAGVSLPVEQILFRRKAGQVLAEFYNPSRRCVPMECVPLGPHLAERAARIIDATVG